MGAKLSKFYGEGSLLFCKSACLFGWNFDGLYHIEPGANLDSTKTAVSKLVANAAAPFNTLGGLCSPAVQLTTVFVSAIMSTRMYKSCVAAHQSLHVAPVFTYDP